MRQREGGVRWSRDGGVIWLGPRAVVGFILQPKVDDEQDVIDEPLLPPLLRVQKGRFANMAGEDDVTVSRVDRVPLRPPFLGMNSPPASAPPLQLDLDSHT